MEVSFECQSLYNHVAESAMNIHSYDTANCMLHAHTLSCTDRHCHTTFCTDTAASMNSARLISWLQLKSLATYGLKGTVTMKGDKLELINLVQVETCGLNVTDAFKGASSAANVEAYKRLEKRCSSGRRRAHPVEAVGPLPPQKLVQQTLRTRPDLWQSLPKQMQAMARQRYRSNEPQASPNDHEQIPSGQPLEEQPDSTPLDRKSEIAEPSLVSKRRQEDRASTDKEVVMTDDMGEIRYMDPLGPEKGYPFWDDR
jgi:hypothetical protein